MALLSWGRAGILFPASRLPSRLLRQFLQYRLYLLASLRVPRAICSHGRTDKFFKRGLIAKILWISQCITVRVDESAKARKFRPIFVSFDFTFVTSLNNPIRFACYAAKISFIRKKNIQFRKMSICEYHVEAHFQCSVFVCKRIETAKSIFEVIHICHLIGWTFPINGAPVPGSKLMYERKFIPPKQVNKCSFPVCV